MERRILGKTGMAVSALGLGTSEIGYEDMPPDAIGRVLGSALDAGLNVIDTAACYGGAEEAIGRAIGARRKEYFILTKCGHSSGLSHRDWSPALVESSIERSLRRLRTDRIDLVQLHGPSDEVLRSGEVIAALKRARDRGLTRFIGYSGDGDGAMLAVKSSEFDTLQISVSIADQEAIDGAIAEAARLGMGIIAKRPIANAVWVKPAGGGLDSYFRPYRDRLKRLDYDFLKAPVRDSVATALRFTLSVPGVHTAIVGTTQPGRWQHNAEAVDSGLLPKTDYDAIRERWRAVAKRTWVGQR
jgi:aryl-alcohol dehydrogenase-like predicted oxidoreductase